jgi:hypothetical protein
VGDERKREDEVEGVKEDRNNVKNHSTEIQH